MGLPIRVAGINFDHFHMGDLLRMAHDHPDVELVGVCDENPERMRDAAKNFAISEDRVHQEPESLFAANKVDLAILCPAASKHGEWTERISPFGCDILVEKPFAGSLAEADQMIAACRSAGVRLAINWPLAWVASHRMAKRLIDEGRIGQCVEVHYYGGNRGPLWHVADKVERTAEEVEREKPNSWFYKRSHGGGSLLDYLGYGTTLGTWYMDGRSPIEVSAMVDQPAGLEVDEHSVVVARYETGLSKFETRWGTFTDPWTHQPQPKCGFVLVGSEGTISSFDYDTSMRVQTRQCPEGEWIQPEPLTPPFQNPIQYMVDVIQKDTEITGPLSTDISRIGQQIVDSAALSAREKKTVPLVQ
ncbi:Gfo/Idh/MocA family oxidoreductase [Roseiconus nitratireducens]|uniref:Gfo/Idh/MocA family oxidoreductase n=1 Tax=Roseiconus nitratireducens TaxID=2605748 RepID=A0A5M6DEQ3_9BACT|nr:Gfo/Idh/MocA family oxidoreductase [Roseiconus nitratireducens]KAA5546007.1 Gfo/Idh/MocA family oxidoreductase [Roseiconus nitratireducens]